MSIEEIKLMAAYMAVHSTDDEEAKCIGHCVMNKVIGSMDGGSFSDATPALSEEKQKEFFDLLQGRADKDEEDAFKRYLIIASAIQTGKLKDMTDGATEFSTEKQKDSYKSKNYYFYKPSMEEDVISSKKPRRKGRKTKKG